MGKSERKLKKIITESLKPQKSFEEWAEDNNIQLTKNKTVSKKSFRQKLFFAVPSLIIIAVMASVLPFVFKRDAPDTYTPPIITEPKIFSALDAKTINSDIEEVRAVSNVYLIDINKIEYMDSVCKEVVKDDSSNELSYVLTKCVVGVGNENGFFAFDVTYRIRLYEYYEFLGCKNYESLEKTITAGGKEVKYSFSNNLNVGKGYAAFRTGEYDYFLEINEFFGMTPINDETLTILFEYLFSE